MSDVPPCGAPEGVASTLQSGFSAGQRRMLAGQRMHPDSPMYNMAFLYGLGGAVDVDRVESAVRDVLRAHEALRTGFVFGVGEPRRVENDPATFCVERVEVPELVFDRGRGGTPEAMAREWSAARSRRVLPEGGWLLEVAVLMLEGWPRFLYVNHHHVITDGWSTPLFLEAVDAAYAGQLVGEGPLYYGRLEASGPSGRTGRRDRMDEVLFYGKRPAERTPASVREVWAMGDAEMAALRKLAGHAAFASFTPAMSEFMAWASVTFAWLYRVSGERVLRMDCPVPNRDTAAAKETLGLFMRMAPLAVTVEAGDSFAAIAAKVREGLRGLHGGASEGAERSLSSAVLNVVPFGVDSFLGAPVEVTWIHPGASDPSHLARVQVHDFGNTGASEVLFDLNEAVFGVDDRERAVEHFRRLFAAAVADPETVVGSVEVLMSMERMLMAAFNLKRLNEPVSGAAMRRATEWVDAEAYGGPEELVGPLGGRSDEGREALVEMHRVGLGEPPRKTVVARFEARVVANPEAVAVVCGETVMTYGELDRRAAAVAGWIAAGTRVGVCFGREPGALVAVLGILKAGASFVPLEPGLPVARLEAMVADAEVGVVVAGEGVDVGVSVRVVRLVEGGGEGEGEGEGWLEAYVMFTSGSSGRPKGIPISHEGLAAYVDWAAEQYADGGDGDFPWFTSLGFDLTLTSLFVPLVSGGTVRIYPATSREMDTAVLEVFAEDAVDVVKLTPSHLALVLERAKPLRRIRRLILGGEQLTTALARKALERFGEHVELFNEYGPTEAVVGCMIHRFDPVRDVGAGVPIGVPAAGVWLRVLNEEGREVPPGVAGELGISRHGLAAGYVNRPDLSVRQFIDFEGADGIRERVYRSGDLVRMRRGGGVLEYLGRMDRQIQLRGNRVEPAEIEARVLEVPGVNSCVVHAVESAVVARAVEVVCCVRCGIRSDVPEVDFEGEVCGICLRFEATRERVMSWFKTPADFVGVMESAKARARGDYDCMVLVSGGKDSTYALCEVAALGLRVLAFTLDNGYLSAQAKANVRSVAERLGVDYEFATTPAMDRIFRDSLERFSNVCQGCFKTVYTLAIKRADVLGIPVVVTGLSRGQFFETRLAESLFRGEDFDPEAVDRAILEARKAYHRFPDVVREALDTGCFEDDRLFESVALVDFYRYHDVDLATLYAALEERVGWTRPTDTGRSTNCLINDLGIHVHKRERGFHNYALPYSWDVRMGHKTRAQAMEELDDEIDEAVVKRMMDEVGYRPKASADGAERSGDRRVLAVYFTAERAVDSAEVLGHLRRHLSAAVLPGAVVQLERLPLTANGKVDTGALPQPVGGGMDVGREVVALEGAAEEAVAGIWAEVLRVPVAGIGAVDSFFEIGGHSLLAMEVMFRVQETFQVGIPLETIFTAPTVRGLAGAVEARLIAEIEAMDEAAVAAELSGEDV